MFEQETVEYNEELDTRKFALSTALQMDIPDERENTVENLLEDAEKIYQWLTKEDKGE